MQNYSSVIEEKPLSINTIMLFSLEKEFHSYEDKLLILISRRQFNRSEEILMDFCMKVIQLPEEEQLFTVRLFFTSFVTNIIRKQAQKGKLHPNVLAHAYQTIAKIESWKNISEYMLHITWFINHLTSNVILDHLIFDGNPIMEKALKMIYDHLDDSELTVNWLSGQLQVSSTHITNLFKKHFNISTSQYIAQMRIKAIIYRLKHSNDSLHTIRKQFGFKNHSHFIQTFKKFTGLTPLQYLQQHIY